MSYSTDRVNYSVLAKSARVNNCWIYQLSSGKWFTPDEILQKENESSGKSKGEVNVRASDFVIKSPYVAVKHKQAQISKLVAEQNEILEKINNHYSVDIKSKR